MWYRSWGQVRGGMASIGTIDWVTDLGLCAGSDRDDLFELLPIFTFRPLYRHHCLSSQAAPAAGYKYLQNINRLAVGELTI